jgi:methylmalonyl-CoA/ethylmalonyl-CoA epimerase
MLFVAGVVVGLAVPIAVAQVKDRGIVQVNHVGVSVPDLDAAVAYYTETLGFPEAFRANDAQGNPLLVYVQVSRDTFIELQPANADRPPGLNHFGIVVEDMDAAIEAFRARGADVSDSRIGSTKSILANITDLNGIRVELSELAPESLQRQAIDRWQDAQ